MTNYKIKDMKFRYIEGLEVFQESDILFLSIAAIWFLGLIILGYIL